MSHATRSSGLRRRARIAALVALPVVLMAPIAARAAAAEMAETSAETEMDGGGAGTDFVACQDRAWSDYNHCLMSYDTAWEKKLCDLAFQADVAWCASIYWRRLKTGS